MPDEHRLTIATTWSWARRSRGDQDRRRIPHGTRCTPSN